MITVCGEGLIDLVPTSTAPLAPLQPALGGGPFNVAIAAARLGAPTRFLSRLSNDAFGEALVGRLREEQVDISLVQRGPEPTTLAVTSLGIDGSASYTFYTEGTADRYIEPDMGLQTGIACFGTCSLALEPGASRYAELLRTLSDSGAFIALDPNIRPFYATAAHHKFLHALLPYVTLLKLSDEEVEFLGPSDVPARVITRGAQGLRVEARGMLIDVPSPPVTVQDTIGAGDTIMGALLAQIELYGGADPRQFIADLTADQWRELLQYAATAAAITCSRVGANPPTRSEVDHTLEI
ncbi:carbohydrate kinase family protein [Corynebacterium freiburgense]|uniref:carbohydrate kinase family protein n=1 Tax=Corynebacterium freiburgense TaxID=556548 RepID=UPI00040F8FE1|nr:carbohydrate kinase [Corynebacterium freiburgense]WJZ03528.1 2-dehydro-3-deoxygluconokinase [Corynebacterium freiburgense]